MEVMITFEDYIHGNCLFAAFVMFCLPDSLTVSCQCHEMATAVTFCFADTTWEQREDNKTLFRTLQCNWGGKVKEEKQM
jgi:hypothetical protein